ncbi:MAG: hypothetical protein ACOYM2_07500 [Rectinemataceae bacterium]
MLEGKQGNDFAVLGDMLSTSLTARFNILPMLSFSLEIPASAMYRYPADLQARLAGSARGPGQLFFVAPGQVVSWRSDPALSSPRCPQGWVGHAILTFR